MVGNSCGQARLSSASRFLSACSAPIRSSNTVRMSASVSKSANFFWKRDSGLSFGTSGFADTSGIFGMLRCSRSTFLKNSLRLSIRRFASSSRISSSSVK